MSTPRAGLPRGALAAVVAYVLVAVALAPGAAFGLGVFGYHDLRHHHLPWRAWAAARWLAGEVPWWASGAGNGFPLLAEGEGGFLYPPTMALFMALPDGLALNWSLLGHHVFGALGMWAYLRATGRRGAAAWVGGLVWGYSGFLVSHALYLGMHNALAWIGWLLYATQARRPALTALGVGMLGLAGHPQAAAFGGLLVAAHALATLGGRELLRTAAGAAAGVLIAAPQLAATLELARFSMREGGVGGVFANVGAMPVQELVGFVLPYAFGFDRPADVTETYYHRGTGYWGAGVNSWETCVYVGVPALVLAALGARRSRFWSGVLVVSVLLMLGGPLWAVVRHLPGFSGFRFPARFALGAVAAIAVLAAHGLDVVRTMRRPRVVATRLWWTAALFSLTTGFAYLGLHTRLGELRAVLTARFEAQAQLPPPPPLTGLAAAALPEPEPEDPAAIPAKVARILADLGRSTAPDSPRVWVPLLLLVATATALRRPRLVVALVALDLLGFGRDYHPTRPTDEVGAAPRWLAPAMTEPGGWRTTVLDRRVDRDLDGELLSASLGLPLGTQDVLLPSPLLLVRNDALLAAGGLDVGDKGAAKVRRWAEHPWIGRRMALRWIASTHELPGLLPRVRGRTFLFEDPQALPRARVVPCRVPAADAEAAFAAVLAEDPRRTVVIEAPDPAGCAGEALAEAEVVSWSDTDVVLHAAGPGTLVLADSAYPGWTATVDGADAPLLVADLLFRGVELAAGEHDIRFQYRPAGLQALLYAGAGALLAVVGRLLWGLRRPGAAARARIGR